MGKRVFLVSSGRLAAYEWSKGRFGEPLVFATDELGLTRYSEYLAHGGTDPVYMLVDFVEEEFREDTIPHVMGVDRRVLVRTKLNRLFRDATYSHAIMQGRESDGRRDDRMLFTALIRPDLLAPWVAPLTRHKVPLAGIYSLPVVSELLLKSLAIDSDHALLVTRESGGGLRQTYFHNKALKLSRLAIMPQVDRRAHPSYLLGEVEKIRRYLNSLRLLPRESPLDVYVVADAALLEGIAHQSPDSLNARHHPLALPEVARRVGLKGEYQSVYADRLFAHLLASKALPNQYAPSGLTRYHDMARMRTAMIAASVLVLVTSTLWSGIKLTEGLVAVREASAARQQSSFYDERYRIARERLPATPADSRDLQAAVEIAERLREQRTTPWRMLVTLSRGVDAFPQVQLDSIDWLSSGDPDARVGGRLGGAAGGGLRETARALLPGRAAPERAAGDGLRYQLARVKGRIDPFDGDYRRALETVSRFAEVLRQQPGIQDVQVVSLPLDIGEQKSLAGDASAEARVGQAPFELRVVLEEMRRAAG